MIRIESSYDKIAKEYYDESHITSRNFDESTKLALKEINKELPKEGLILEVGAGKGRASEYLSVDSNRIIQLDNCKAMLELTPREESLIRIHADGLEMPFMDNSFDLVVSFLCDPFLGMEFLSEAFRVLKKDGILLFTTPAYNWGKALRDKIGLEINETRFITKDEKTVKVPSILIKSSQVIEMLDYLGFENHSIKFIEIKLNENIKTISKDILASAERQDKSPYDIELLNLFYGKK